MNYFAKPPVQREQMVLFSTTLDERIPEDHPVRLVWEVLSQMDFSDWERRYCQGRGQPPIPPRVVAAALLYGMSQGIRSSRRLEYACSNGIDFLWLVEGRQIDHSTFCGFRTRFQKELKDLFRQIGSLAIGMGMMRLNEVGLDGTRVRANSSRFSTATSKTLEERLAVLDEQIAEMFAASEAADRRDGLLFDQEDSPTSLPGKLATLERRQEALGKALAAARSADAKRGKSKGCVKDKREGTGHAAEREETVTESVTSGDGKQASPKGSGSKRRAKVPVADPESVILPNKEGGYAPNYTPVATVDGQCGMIADCDVLSSSSEAETVAPTVERIAEDFGQTPERFLADGAFATGHNLSWLADRGVEAYMPVASNRDVAGNPAVRSDPLELVEESLWGKLPRRAQSKKLDRSAFVYDAASDCYFCPMGRKLAFIGTKAKSRGSSSDSIYRQYRCETCEGCPLACECLSGRRRCRTVSHDQHEVHREAAARRLASDEGRQVYARRAWLAETPNAVIKTCMGIRQFLLRGLEKVRTEWLWACTAFNVAKLVRWIAGLRLRLVGDPG